ncbi:unnamed protein product [Cutaneotrichosporon oleaginosum]
MLRRKLDLEHRLARVLVAFGEEISPGPLDAREPPRPAALHDIPCRPHRAVVHPRRAHGKRARLAANRGVHSHFAVCVSIVAYGSPKEAYAPSHPSGPGGPNAEPWMSPDSVRDVRMRASVRSPTLSLSSTHESVEKVNLSA